TARPIVPHGNPWSCAVTGEERGTSPEEAPFWSAARSTRSAFGGGSSTNLIGNVRLKGFPPALGENLLLSIRKEGPFRTTGLPIETGASPSTIAIENAGGATVIVSSGWPWSSRETSIGSMCCHPRESLACTWTATVEPSARSPSATPPAVTVVSVPG